MLLVVLGLLLRVLLLLVALSLLLLLLRVLLLLVVLSLLLLLLRVLLLLVVLGLLLLLLAFCCCWLCWACCCCCWRVAAGCARLVASMLCCGCGVLAVRGRLSALLTMLLFGLCLARVRPVVLGRALVAVLLMLRKAGAATPSKRGRIAGW